MKRWIFFVVCAAGLTAQLSEQLSARPSAIVIRNARVIDGTGAPARAATVVIRGARIESVAADAAVPADATVIDAAGQTLIPGLFDLHSHLAASGVTGVPGDWGKNLKAYLDCGVTTVNDFSTSGETIAPMHRLLTSGAVAGPHVEMAVRLGVPGGHGTEGGWGDFMTLTATTPEEAHARMKTALAYHPDVIKIFTDGWRYGTGPDLPGINLETLTAMVEDAHAAGLKVFTHTVTLEGAKIAVRAGVDTLAHGIGNAPVDDELIGLMQAKHTFYVSTLAVYETKGKAVARELDLLNPAAGALFAGRVGNAQRIPARERRWKFLLENVRQLRSAGIGVAVGTDAGETSTLHGYAPLREMELLVEAGLGPLDAISAATRVSAQALGVEKDRGTIVPGKIADLVLIDGRPDERIADIEKTARVFFEGAEVDRKVLEAAIQSPDPTPLPSHGVAAQIDDMERADGRTSLGTLRVNSTDAGVDHSTMMFLRVLRGANDHALMIEARMAAKPRPYVRLELPLTPGAIELADVNAFQGISFDVRGEGAFRLLAYAHNVPAASGFAAPFDASGEWQTVRIPFTALRSAVQNAAWNGRNIRALAFELVGPAGAGVWLELDNVSFF
jgi:imidazolonepropionase-like amidohydrolase